MSAILLLPALMVLAADQSFKALLLRRMPTAAAGKTFRLARLRPVRNPRAFMAVGRKPVLLLILWLAALAYVLLLRAHGDWFESLAGRIALSAAFGGAASNLLDRLRLNAVIDYLDPGFGIIFNLADIAIVSGVLGCILVAR